MPLNFHDLCTLLSDLESYCICVPPLLPVSLKQKVQERTRQWFRNHKITITSVGVDVVALLSALFPEKRTDRVYSLKAPSLSRRLRGCLCLGNGRWQLLDQWKTPGRGDLGDCVERALKQSEFPKQTPENAVTLEQVDSALADLAARNRFSGPDVQQSKENEDPKEVDRILQQIYRRLQSREAKWFTRILIKDLGPMDLPMPMVLGCLHPYLQEYIRFYDTFEAAVGMLRSRGVPSFVPEGQNNGIQQNISATHTLTPKVGVKLGRIKYSVGRSVKHAVSMIGRRKMSVERKYDGEYCQIHVDLAAGKNWIKIFSKSGKDSTVDRAGLQESIKNCLRIGREDCGFTGQCILEGELVVWSDREKDILDFCKIRKHVSRSGSFLGTNFDSQPHDFEHLMIIFYDVMLIDNEPILNISHTRRRRLLKKLITPISGRAALAVRDIIDFTSPHSPSQLQQALARAFALRWEGLVLKPCDELYFSTRKPSTGEHPNCWIKMKKDYIKGLGDTADFAVVGAGYDVNEAKKFGGLKLNWTHFHVGCLTNKDEVTHHGAKPKFVVVDALNLCIKPEDLKTLNHLGQFRAVRMGSRAEAAAHGMKLEPGVPDMAVAFRDPFVFEVMGAGFDKQGNRTTFSLRFPRVIKIHWDRDWKEAVTIDELQDMASAAKLVPSDDLAEDVAQWLKQLKQVDRGVKGVLAPWEDSQDVEMETAEFSPVRTTRDIRHARSKSEAPPMVRMDSKEMSQSEYRLENGDVLRRPTSRQSDISGISGSSLLTPPTSSPFRAVLDSIAKKHLPTILTRETNRESRKRKVEDTASEEVTSSDEASQFKRARRFFRAYNVNNERRPTNLLDPTAPSKALQDLANSNRPRETPRVKPARRTTRRSLTPETFLVRKIPIGVSGPTHTPPIPALQPSSPARETTASEYTSQGTSQRTITPRAGARPPFPHMRDATPSPTSHKPQSFTMCPTTPPSPAPHKSTSPSQQSSTPNPTPSSSNPPATATPSMDIRIPDLMHSQIFLSPCIARMPYLTDDLLGSLHISAQPFRQDSLLPTWTSSSFPSRHHSNDDNYNSILVLIESKRKDPTVNVLKFVALQLQHCSTLSSVEIWDWRLLEIVAEGRAGNVGDRVGDKVGEELRDCFYGRMRWDDGAEAIEVVWRDGKVTRGGLPDNEVEES